MMINKLIVYIFCIVAITATFSFDTLGNQNDKNQIFESRIIDLEVARYEFTLNNTNADKSYSASFIDTLDQEQTNDSNYAFTVTGEGYFAQSFIPTLERLTRVELKIYKKGTIDGVRISIRTNLTGPDLTWMLLLATHIPTNKTWVEFNFLDIFVTPGETYYIIWDPVGNPDCNNNTYWCLGDNNPYSNGFPSICLYSWWMKFNPVNFSNPDFCFKTYGLPKENNPPNKPATPIGDTTGKIGVVYRYESVAYDIDGDQIYYLFDWNDGNTSGWLGPYDSGTTLLANHSWSLQGSYSVKVKAKDTFGAESPWSDPLAITMPYSFIKPISSLLEIIFQRFFKIIP